MTGTSVRSSPEVENKNFPQSARTPKKNSDWYFCQKCSEVPEVD